MRESLVDFGLAVALVVVALATVFALCFGLDCIFSRYATKSPAEAGGQPARFVPRYENSDGGSANYWTVLDVATGKRYLTSSHGGFIEVAP